LREGDGTATCNKALHTSISQIFKELTMNFLKT